jgi:hypothetical protein
MNVEVLSDFLKKCILKGGDANFHDKIEKKVKIRDGIHQTSC